MNWLAFALAAWVMIGLDIGLAPLIAPSGSGVVPSFAMPLLVFVALHASHRPSLWAGVALGILVDLTHALPRSDGGGVITLVGPNALGYLLAAQFVLSVRGMVIRRNPLTMIFLSIFAAGIAGIVAVAIQTVRTIYPDPVVWKATSELMQALGSAAFTGVSAAVVSMLLFSLVKWFGFPGQSKHPYPGRA